MRGFRDNRIKTRRISLPQPSYTPQLDLRRRGGARRRYQARYRRNSTFRALMGWFFLGTVAAAIFVVIVTPLAIRSLPAHWVDRLPPFLKCLHPNFCRTDVLPTAAAPVDVESLLVVQPDDGQGETVAAAPTPTLPPTDPPQPSPTAAALDFSTPVPTETPLAVADASAAVAAAAPAAVGAVPLASRLGGFRLISQTWNNCAPATLAMGLNFWGWEATQAVVARVLRPDPNDKSVSVDQMVAFVNDEVPGLRAVTRHAGSIALIKRLIVSGYPVIIRTSFAPDGLDWMGHYRLIVGYDDAEGTFQVFDSYLGAGSGEGLTMSYDAVDRDWQHFNRQYIVIYPENQEAHLAGLLGDDWDPKLNAQHALRTAQIEAQMDRVNPFAWFNLGTGFVLNGQYEEATRAYDEARNLGLPWRMLWYQFGPFEAYLHANRLDDVIVLARTNAASAREVEETYYYWGLALAQRGEYAEAERKFRQAIAINRNFAPAHAALQELP